MLLILGIFAAEICFLVFLNQKDNKYCWPGPAGSMGVTDLTGPQERSFVYLVHGWEVYEGRLLSPEDRKTGAYRPDRYVSLGRYGGFEFGDSTRDPRGCVTYRMKLLLPEDPAEYCLELPEIFSAYHLWIDGRQAKTMGVPEREDYQPSMGNSYIIFEGRGETEILLAVSNYSSFYSGMVYPPAFGSPDGVRNTIYIRAMVHCVLASSALLLGLVCLQKGIKGRDAPIYRIFFLMCLCFSCYCGYPVIHFLNIPGDGWYLAEKTALYLMILTVCNLAGRMFRVPVVIRCVVFGAGCAVCLLVLAFPLFPMRWDVGSMRLYSGILSSWQWFAAAYLGMSGVWAFFRKERFARGILLGTGVFSCALISRRILPAWEPVYTGWPLEWGGLFQILVIAGGLTADTRKEEWNMAQLRRRVDMAEEHLHAQKDYAQMLSLYLKQTGKRNHEVKKHMELLSYYYNRGEYDRLGAYIRTLQEQSRDIEMPLYTANILINSIITARFRRAGEAGIRTEHNLLGIPQDLTIADSDLCSLLANLLDNAVEGCQRLEAGRERWIKVGMQVHNQYLSIVVENSAKDPPENWQKEGWEAGQTEKGDTGSHGYGLELIGEIVEKYQGMKKVRWENGVFMIHTALRMPEGHSGSRETGTAAVNRQGGD